MKLFELSGADFKELPSKPYTMSDKIYANTLYDFVALLIFYKKNGLSKIDQDDFLFAINMVRDFYYTITEQNVFLDAENLLRKKSQDYNGDRVNELGFTLDDKRTEYFPFGDESYLHMIWTKVQRIKSIINSDKEPNFEGVKDSLIDVSAYLSFYYSHYLYEESLFE